MSAVSIIVAVALGLAVLISLLCAVGALVMRDPLQRLHYLAPPATLSAFLVVIAAVVQSPRDWQAALKTLMVALLLVMINAVVTHATARAALQHMGAQHRAAVPERVPLVDLDGDVIGEAELDGEHRGEATPWT